MELEKDTRFIFDGLKNQADVAKLQKALFRKYVDKKENSYDKEEDEEEKHRLLKECNDQLVHILVLLEAFKEFDDDLEGLQDEVDKEWMDNLDLEYDQN